MVSIAPHLAMINLLAFHDHCFHYNRRQPLPIRYYYGRWLLLLGGGGVAGAPTFKLHDASEYTE